MQRIICLSGFASVVWENSGYAIQYNLAALPAAYIISDGALVDGQAVDEKNSP